MLVSIVSSVAEKVFALAHYLTANARSKSRCSFRPVLEELQERLAPAVETWDGGGGANTDWTNPLNWAGDVLPGVNDTARFAAPPPAANPIAVVNQNVTVAGVQIESTWQHPLSIVNGVVLKVTASLAQHSGTLAGSGGVEIDSHATFTWAAGGFTEAVRITIVAGATLDIIPGGAGAATKEVKDSATVANYGTARWGATNFSLLGNSRFENWGTFNINGTGTIQRDITFAALFENRGIVRKAVGGTATVRAQFDNYNLVELQTVVGQSNDLAFTNRGTHHTNSQITAANQTVVVFNVDVGLPNRLTNLRNGVRWTGAGGFRAEEGAILNVSSPVGASDVHIENLVLDDLAAVLGSGNLHITGQFNWRGGTLGEAGTLVIEKDAHATIEVSPSAADRVLDRRTLQNYGRITWNSGDIEVKNAPKIINSSELEADKGVFDMSPGANITKEMGQDYGEFIVENNGLLKKSAGVDSTIDMKKVYRTGGKASISGAKVEFTAPMPTLVPADTVIDIDAGGTLAYAGDIDQEGGEINVVAGGLLASGGEVYLTGGQLTLAGTLTAAELVRLSDAGFLVGIGGTINADVSNAATLLDGGEFGYSMLYVNGDYTQTAGLTDVNGSLLDVAGELRLAAGTLKMRNWATLESDLGVWIDPGATVVGGGTVRGNLINAGVLTIGDDLSPVMGLTVTGNYTQTAAGVLNLQARSSATGDYDFIHLLGTAALAGTLNFSFLDGYTPFVGEVFSLLYYGGLSGSFGTLNLPSSGSGTWGPRYNDPPGTFSLWVV